MTGINKNKNAFVSGASGKIGQAIALRLAEDGWNLGLQAQRQIQVCEELALRCCEKKVSAKVYPCDLENVQQIREMGAMFLQDFGDISCLVNNAGIAQQKAVTDIFDYEWEKMLSVNLSSVFHLSQQFIPTMIREKSGRIINISSIWGRVGASCESHYAAAKAGILGWSKSLAKELGPSGITVNALCPGVIDTDMNQFFTAEEVEALIAQTPLNRLGRPEDVAEAVAFLASEQASFITCQVLGIDGGFGL